MSGVVVIHNPLGKKGEVEALVPCMCEPLCCSDHKGPVEWYVGPGFGIGRCRPALVNQEAQPAWNEDRTICVFFHGELFGYRDRRRSMELKGHRFSDDSHAEFVVHLYEDLGDAFIHELNGSFALGLWDGRQQRLVIANDRYGLCPLYTAVSGGGRFWASSPKAILADADFPRKVSLPAMADFLALGFPQGNDTMFDGIDELPPASFVVCQEGQVHRQQYWDLSFQEEESGISANDYLDALIPLLRKAAERRQMGGLRAGLLLSGGLDSRVILSVVRKDAIEAFTFGTPYCDDVRFGRQAAQAAGVPHTALVIKPNYLESFARIGIERMEDLVSCDQFHSIGVYDEIAAHVNALITGSAGEDVFGRFAQDPEGEFWGSGFSVDRRYDRLCFMKDGELEQLMRPAYFRQMKGLARSRFHRDFEKCPSRHVAHKENYWSIKQRQRRRSNRLSSLFPETLVFRPLFYDNDVMDFVQTIPPLLRWGERTLYRQVVVREAPGLARIRATTTHGLALTATHAQMAKSANRRYIRNQWIARLNRMNLRVSRGLIPPIRKTAFYADYREWLRRELRGWMESILLDRRTLNRQYWNSSAIKLLMEMHLRGMRGAKALPRKLMALISFELWHRMYLD